jgi:hypothetical protein
METSQTFNKSENTTATNDSPLLLFQPFNIVVFLSFFSPIILAVSMVLSSFMFQNVKGLIYLGFLISACIIRTFVYHYSGGKPVVFNDTICTTIQYTKYGNASFSVYVFAFTIMYLFLPMFVNGGDNYILFSAILLYAFIDMMIKFYKKCILTIGDLFINLLSGLGLAALVVSLMYFGGSGKYLFFNEISSNKEICSMPSKQTFKCSVYKNGQLVGNV